MDDGGALSRTHKGARRPLNRARIVEAALRLIDERGLDGLSIRRLGAELGVEGPALYRHVEGKEEILDGVRQLLVGEFAATQSARGPFSGWRDHLQSFAHAYRAVGLAHPEAFPLLARAADRAYAAGREVAAAALTCLIDAGFDRETAIGAERTVARYVLGFSLIGRAAEEAPAPVPVSELRELDREQPVLGDLVRSLGPERDEALFGLGLSLILDGLEARLGDRPAEPGVA